MIPFSQIVLVTEINDLLLALKIGQCGRPSSIFSHWFHWWAQIPWAGLHAWQSCKQKMF